MDDAEIRGRLLHHFFRLRHMNNGNVPTDDIILSPHDVGRPAVAAACEQLAAAGYIRLEPFGSPLEQNTIGRAKITGAGIDVVTGGRAPVIDVHFPVGDRYETPIPGTSKAPTKELFTLRPTMWGLGVVLKEARYRAHQWWIGSR